MIGSLFRIDFFLYRTYTIIIDLMIATHERLISKVRFDNNPVSSGAKEVGRGEEVALLSQEEANAHRAAID